MSKLASLERQRSSAAAAVTDAISYAEPAPKKTPLPHAVSASSEAIERITITIPASLLEQVDARLARLGRRKRVSLSGYIEAGLRELLAAGEADLEALSRHTITKRRRIKAATPKAS